MTYLRQIIEEGSFEESRTRIEPDARRLDAILEGVWIQLCRSAESGTVIPGTGLLVIRTADYPDAPALSIIYRFDDEHVYLLYIELY